MSFYMKSYTIGCKSWGTGRGISAADWRPTTGRSDGNLDRRASKPHSRPTESRIAPTVQWSHEEECKCNPWTMQSSLIITNTLRFGTLHLTSTKTLNHINTSEGRVGRHRAPDGSVSTLSVVRRVMSFKVSSDLDFLFNGTKEQSLRYCVDKSPNISIWFSSENSDYKTKSLFGGE